MQAHSKSGRYHCRRANMHMRSSQRSLPTSLLFLGLIIRYEDQVFINLCFTMGLCHALWTLLRRGRQWEIIDWRLLQTQLLQLLIESLFIANCYIEVLKLKPWVVSAISARSEGMIISICLMTCLEEKKWCGWCNGKKWHGFGGLGPNIILLYSASS